MKKLLSILSIVLMLCICFSGCTLTNETPNLTNETPNGSSNNVQQDATIINVNNIFLSKSEITLGIEETATLIATVSPSNAESTLTWSSSNENVANVDNDGKVTAKSEGDAVITVESDNGILAVCNVTVKIKTGSVSGKITYKYNNFVGNRGDVGSKIILVSKNVTSLPDKVALGMANSSFPEGCFGATVDGDGNYSIDNVPVGEYYIVAISNNTNENSSYVSGFNWGSVYYLFSDKGQENALLTAQVYKTRTSSVTVNEGKTTTYSYDFGVTYIAF